jgi:phosphoenolpyruvate phosphomutase
MAASMFDVLSSPPTLGPALLQAAAAGIPLRAVGAVNALAACVAAEAGFDALWVSGLEVSASLGLPDENVLGSRDLVDVVLALGRAAGLPVIVDIDNAGGSAATAGRFGGDLARAGAAALCVEDSAYPKVNSFAVHRRQQLAGPALMGDQLAAMREAAGQHVVLIARTETLICGGTIYANQLSRAAFGAMRAAAAVFATTGSSTVPGGPPLVDVQTLLRVGNRSARACL